MREHDGLRRPGRAGGVDVGRGVVLLERPGALVERGLGDLGGAGEEGLPGEHARVVGDRGGALHEDDRDEARELVPLLPELVVLGSVLDDDDRGLGVVDDVLHLARRAGGVDAGRDAAGGDRREGADGPLGPVVAEQADALAGRQPEREHGPGGLADLGGVLAPRGGLPVAAAPDEVGGGAGAGASLGEEAGGDRVCDPGAPGVRGRAGARRGPS